MKKFVYIWLLLILVFFSVRVKAQFYNGHQMTFGKNRIQFNLFYWQFYRFDKYDAYFYKDGKQLAEYTVKTIDKVLPEMETFFSHNLDRRLIFLVYNKLSEFRQSNIGLISGSVESNIGGVTTLSDNKVIVYFDGDHRNFERQIKAAIAEILFNELLYGNNFRQKVTSSTLLNLPEWYRLGLISYASCEWNISIENTVKDGIRSKKYRKFNHLRGEDAKFVGHSIWRYIAENYGKNTVHDILYFTRINKNADNGFSNVLGIPMKMLKNDWLEYYQNQFDEQASNSELPKEIAILKKPKKSTIYQSVKVNPTGKLYAYVSNIMGKYKIFIYNEETGKTKKILTKEHKLEQINDYSFPVLAWHPSGKSLAFVTEEKGFLFLTQYFPQTNEYMQRTISDLEKILSFSFSDNGLYIVMSAVSKGWTDIFVFSTSAGTLERITNDVYDDLNPSFIDKSTKILFASNRFTDTLSFDNDTYKPMSKTTDLFVYNYQTKDKILQRITNTPRTDENQAYWLRKNTYIYLSDDNGIINRKIAAYDSTISYIDTSTHYRYFSTEYPLSNLSSNILDQDINTKTGNYAEIIKINDRYHIFQNRLNLTKNSFAGKFQNTEFKNQKNKTDRKQDSLEIKKRKKEIEDKKKIDSLLANPPKNYIHPDSTKIDINNYVFEKDKDTPYKILYLNDYNKKQNQEDTLSFPRPKIYQTTFYKNYLVTQVDFGTLNESYQLFNGGPFYFNPGINAFIKIGINDLFEDYKLIGAFRLAGNLNSYEYLFSIENVKKQLDKQIMYHRQSYIGESNYYLVKYITNDLFYVLRYPFSQVTALKGTISGRYDSWSFLSIDYPSLAERKHDLYSCGAKGEFIFDNTIDVGLNLYDGVRFKMFGEYYRVSKYNVFVLGGDFRYYKKIHRSLIFASRIGTSSSFGTGKIIYYLGGVDNWTPLSQYVEMFDKSIEIDQKENYVFQSVATNMRGFIQNIRNGNNFAVWNNEIRFPVIRYLANRPINSDFFNNLQLVGFADIGSAWSGISPFHGENAYNKYIYYNKPITVTVDVQRAPLLFGYGFGLRSRLFGYFLRLDWAWGIDGDVILPRIFYFSLDMDF